MILVAYKLPTMADIPDLETVLIQTGGGTGPYEAKAIGELANNATAAAIANAVAAAGRAMGLPTSTVSRRVARLEDHLGARLLHRTTRKLSLTDAGHVYYDRGSAALADLEAIERSLADRQGEPRGRIRMTAPLGLAGLSPLVTQFLKAYPDVEIDLDLTNRRVDLIQEGYDLAIRGGRLRDSSLVARHLAEIAFVLVASPEYLERCGGPKGVAELRHHDCVILGSRADQATWTLEVRQRRIRVPVSGRFASNHWDGVRDAATSGLGIALLPEPHAREALHSGQLRRILPSARAPGGDFWVVYPSRRHVPAAVRGFVDFCAANARMLAGAPKRRRSAAAPR